ncbi:MAG: PsbP-related protein [bacterium]
MKRTAILASCLMVALAGSMAFAEDTELRAKVEAFYQKLDRATETENLDEFMSCFTPDYMEAWAGPNRAQLKAIITKNNADQENITARREFKSITRAGKFIQVLSRVEIKADKAGGGKHEMNLDEVQFLIPDGDSFKIQSRANAKPEQYAKYQGNTCMDDITGIQFSVPEGWVLVPGAHPYMQGVTFMLAPDGTSAAMFGYLELPSNLGAKEGLEGDDAVCKTVAKDFEKFHAGDYTVGNLKGYESITRFTIPGDDRDRKRWRVYFTGGGLLITFNFDAIPAEGWDSVKPDFEKILASFSMTPEAQKDAASQVRALTAKGEVAGQIYSNDELGCQIAAPKDWTLKTSTLGSQFKFLVDINPPAGESIVRFLAVDTQGQGSLEQFIKGDMDALKKISKDAELGEVQDLELSGYPAKLHVSRFAIEGLGNIKRKAVYILVKNMLYCIVCDAKPASEFDSVEPHFDAVIQSFTIN